MRKKTLRVVYYGRVSTEHEEQISALDNQKVSYEILIKSRDNWELVGTYVDEGKTGTSTKRRTDFQQMIEDGIKWHKFDLIITREVSRFARNTVDTLVYVRDLKAVGIGVYFINDNIDTSDDSTDWELRLGLFATFAQNESAKVASRCKAGLKIAREKGVILGSGNVMGYDKDKNLKQFIVNPEQAKTVQMIYKWYLEGNGMKKIKNLLELNHRLTATGKDRWEISAIGRALSNPMYIGYQYQQQSVSDGYLTQNRVKNDKENYILVKAKHEPIISEEVYKRVQELKSERLTHDINNKITGKRVSKDIWTQKLICSCGSRYKSYKWREGIVGYSCYNQSINNKKTRREKLGLSTEGACDLKSICDWKLEMLMWRVVQKTWTTGQEDIEQAFNIIKECYKSEKDNNDGLLERLEKSRSRLEKRNDNLTDMRSDGEISKEEFLKKKTACDIELEKINTQIASLDIKKEKVENLDDTLLKIKETMSQLIDFSSGIIDHDILEKIIVRIVHTDDYEFDIYLDLGMGLDNCGDGSIEVEKDIVVKNFNNTNSLEVLREKHIKLFDMQIGFDEAREYRKMNKKYLRESQWVDMDIHVYL